MILEKKHAYKGTLTTSFANFKSEVFWLICDKNDISGHHDFHLTTNCQVLGQRKGNMAMSESDNNIVTMQPG